MPGKKRQKQPSARPKKELLDAHGRPIRGGGGPGFVYTAKGDIYRQRIVIPDEKAMRDALARHIQAMLILRPLTLQERETWRNLKALDKPALARLYEDIILQTPNPEHEAHIAALKKQKKRLEKGARRIVLPK